MMDTIITLVKDKAFLTGLGTISVGVISYVRQQKAHKRSIKSVIDEEQNKSLLIQKSIMDEHSKVLADLITKIDAFGTRLDTLAIMVEGFNEDRILRLKTSDLREKVKLVGFNVIDTYGKEIDSSVRSMILDGCLKSGELFADNFKNGIESIDTTRLKLEAITALRSIRGQYVGGHKIDEAAGIRIKENVAYPLLNQIVVGIKGLQDEPIDDDIDELYSKLVIRFAREFILKSLKEIKQA